MFHKSMKRARTELVKELGAALEFAQYHRSAILLREPGQFLFKRSQEFRALMGPCFASLAQSGTRPHFKSARSRPTPPLPNATTAAS